MSDHRRVTFYSGGRFVPSSRFRVHPIAQHLAQRGWHTTVKNAYGALDQSITSKSLQKAYRGVCKVLRAARTACEASQGPIIAQRLALPWSSVPEQVLTKRGRRLVFDFDDAIFQCDDGRLDPLRRQAIQNVMNASAHVVAGNCWLASHVPENVPVTVIPTCLDTVHYRPPDLRPLQRPVRIGWIGTSTNLKFLKALEGALRRLRFDGAPFQFIVCSDRAPETWTKNLGVEFIRWSPEAELPFLQSLDIGVMPLDDTDWCRGKCSFKLIQYMAVGCAVVASPVGFNKDVVQHGKNGYLTLGSDWYAPLNKLIFDDDERQRLAQAARTAAQSRFDITRAVFAYEQILESLLEPRSS